MSSKPSKTLLLPADYAQWLASLKSQISGARQRAVLSANREQIRLYHRIGSEILERQQRQGWGAKVIGRLSSDLQEAFPEMKGFSTSNLKYMRYFAEQWPTGLIGQQTADQLPWFHTRLKCYVVVELKATAFKPGHAGQLNFYLSAVDAQIKAPDDKPTIGLSCSAKLRSASSPSMPFPAQHRRVPTRPLPARTPRHQPALHRRNRSPTRPQRGGR